MNMYRENFWNSKILKWETKNYNSKRRPSLFKPVHYRLEVAAHFLQPLVSNRTLLDLGCGSGRLFKKFFLNETCQLIGLDFSDQAIARGRQQFTGVSNVTFVQGDVATTDWPASDIVVGLGILDWLSPSDSARIFKKAEGRLFLFTYSEKRPSLLRWGHSIYVFLSYGWRSGYKPKYHGEKEIRVLSGEQELFFLRKPELAFGTFVANFPLEEPHVCKKI